MNTAEDLANHLAPDVIVAPVALAEDFRRIILDTVCLNLVYRIRVGEPLPGVSVWMDKDYGSGPWFERHALDKGGESGFETWRAMVARLKSRLADLEVVRLISLGGRP